MAQYKVKDTSLAAVADAIREKAGTSDALEFPGGFVEAVNGISGGGFVDGNLTFAEHTVTVTEDNGVTNFANLVNYFVTMTGSTTIFCISLVGIADTYNQVIICDIGAFQTKSYGISYRYRDGYQKMGDDLWMGPTNFTCALVPGTQYKVYSVERIE